MPIQNLPNAGDVHDIRYILLSVSPVDEIRHMSHPVSKHLPRLVRLIVQPLLHCVDS
jgi:hypothetical protein